MYGGVGAGVSTPSRPALAPPPHAEARLSDERRRAADGGAALVRHKEAVIFETWRRKTPRDEWLRGNAAASPSLAQLRRRPERPFNQNLESMRQRPTAAAVGKTSFSGRQISAAGVCVR